MLQKIRLKIGSLVVAVSFQNMVFNFFLERRRWAEGNSFVCERKEKEYQVDQILCSFEWVPISYDPD